MSDNCQSIIWHPALLELAFRLRREYGLEPKEAMARAIEMMCVKAKTKEQKRMEAQQAFASQEQPNE